jgi:hypothetical protein
MTHSLTDEVRRAAIDAAKETARAEAELATLRANRIALEQRIARDREALRELEAVEHRKTHAYYDAKARQRQAERAEIAAPWTEETRRVDALAQNYHRHFR